MKTYTRSFVVEKIIKVICASILMLGASAVYADPAYIITSGQCGMADGDGGFFTSSHFKQVVQAPLMATVISSAKQRA